jgi:hypothetical protein
MAFDCEGYCEIWRESFPVAKKEHKCCECRTLILPGERYCNIFTLYEGDASTSKQHLCCWSMARHINLDIVGHDLVRELTGLATCAYAMGDIPQFFHEDKENPQEPYEHNYWGLRPLKNFTDEQYHALKAVWERIKKGECRDWRRPGENPDDNLHGYETPEDKKTT